jgi:hypothetical protein
MREIRLDNLGSTFYQLENDNESKTLSLSINTFLNGIIQSENLINFSDPENDKVFIGYLIAEDLVEYLDKGIEILASDAELYLAKISLQYFLSFFEYSVREKLLGIASQELAMTEEQLINHAITGLNMLRQFPKTDSK